MPALVAIGTADAFGQFGPTITAPALLNSNATTDTLDDKSPRLATNGSGNWVAVWESDENLSSAGTDKDIFVSRSTDNGATWTAVALLNSNATTDTGDDKKPWIETDGSGNWVVVWESKTNLSSAGVDADIFVSRSTDNGATWTAVALLNSNAATDGVNDDDKSPVLETDGSGNWVALWESKTNLSGAGVDSDIFASRSTDNGATWTAVALLNSNAATDTLDDKSPRLVTDGSGNWVTVWESDENLSSAGADKDIFVSRSMDNGATWSTVALLNSNATTDTGDDKKPVIATDSLGNWVAVWSSKENLSSSGVDEDIFISLSTDSGVTWSAVALLNSNATTDTGNDKDVSLATDGQGNWIAVWNTNDTLGSTIGTDDDILVSQSTNNGAAWTAVQKFNNNADTDAGNDKKPFIATDSSCHWVVVWESDENLSSAGTDKDIVVARFVVDVAVIITESGGSTHVTEGGTTDTYTVVLSSLPTATVTVTADPDAQTDLGSGAGVAIVLTFTTSNWNTAQTVTVTAVDDMVAEGSHTSTITHTVSSASDCYDGIAVNSVTANITEFGGDWKLDDGSGATVTDCSAGGNDGSLKPNQVSGPQWVTAGQVCSALDFDGTDDYVNVPAAASLDLTTDVSITGWFKLDSTFNSSSTTSQILFEKYASDTDNLVIALVGTDYGTAAVADGSLVFKIETSSGGERYKWTTTTSWTAGTWYHFAVLLDVSANANNKIYIDGTDDTGGNSGAGTTADFSFSADVNIGGKDADSAQLSAARYTAGVIDDIHLFRGTLSAANIANKAAEANYTVTDLGVVVTTGSVGQAINSSDEIAGFDDNTTSGVETGWIWRNDVLTNLGTLGGTSTVAFDVNNGGTVVGVSNLAAGARRAFSWTAGSGMTDLGTLSGRTDSEALGVNASNQVVGVALDFNPGPINRLAFLYLPTAAYSLSAGMNDLGNLGGDQAVALDINDSGQVVGGSSKTGTTKRPFLWLPSAAYGLSAGMNDLGTLGGESGSILHRAEGVNSLGEIVGLSYTSGGDAHAFLWLPSAAHGLSAGINDLGTLTGGSTSWAFSINASAKVVGTSEVTGGIFHAFLWDTGVLTDLNDEIDPGSTWVLTRATDISSDGDIVGWGTNPSSANRGFRLKPATCGCPAGAAAAASFIPSLTSGVGIVNGAGELVERLVGADGQRLAEIIITGAAPGAAVEYAIAGPVERSEGRTIPAPGTLEGFVDGAALGRTLRADSRMAPGTFTATLSLLTGLAELADLRVEPQDMELHVLDPARGVSPDAWFPAGNGVGETEPTGILGESGFVVREDGSVEYWAVRDTLGHFAIGRGADPGDPDVTPVDVNRPRGPCGAGLLIVMLPATGLFVIRRAGGRLLSTSC